MKTILTFMLLFTAVTMVGAVYAEEIKDTIIVPFDWNQKLQGFQDDGSYIVQYFPNGTINLPDAIFNGTDTIDDVLEAQQIIPEITVNATEFIEVITEKPTKFEEDLLKFEENPPTKGSDKEYHELLKNLAECQRGYAESRGIATNEWFPVSFTWVNDGEAWIKSFDYTGRYGDLKKAIEECQAIRTILNPVTLGVESYNKGQYFNQTQPYHSDIANRVPTWSQERVNQESNQNIKADNTNPICAEDSYYSDLTKKMYCDTKVPVITGGVIHYESEVEDRFIQYGEDKGKAQVDELIKKSLEKKLKQMRELRNQLESLN